RLADAKLAPVRLLEPRDHAEERGLACTVRTNDADDAAGWQSERQFIDEQAVAVSFAQARRFDHDVAEARTRRNDDPARFLAILDVRGEQLFVGGQARLALGLPRAGRHAHPLELARQRALAR